MGTSSFSSARSTAAPPASDSTDRGGSLAFTRALSDRLMWQSRDRRSRIARYALWRTRFRGPDPSQLGTISAPGTTQLCNSCRFFANTPHVVCSVHPDGPGQPICPDWDRSEPLHPKEH